MIGTHSTTGVFPGAKATYRFTGQPAAVSLKLEQYPVLLLMVILAKTLDTLRLISVAVVVPSTFGFGVNR